MAMQLASGAAAGYGIDERVAGDGTAEGLGKGGG